MSQIKSEGGTLYITNTGKCLIKATWPYKAVMDLISAIKTVNLTNLVGQKRSTRRNLYKKIREILKEKDHNYSIKQIVNKYKKMKGEYRKVLTKLSRSGNLSEARKWVYFIPLHGVLGHLPEHVISLPSTRPGPDSIATQSTSGFDSADVSSSIIEDWQDDLIVLDSALRDGTPEKNTCSSDISSDTMHPCTEGITKDQGGASTNNINSALQDIPSDTASIEESCTSSIHPCTERITDRDDASTKDEEDSSQDNQPRSFGIWLESVIDKLIKSNETQAQLNREASRNDLAILLHALDATANKFIEALKRS